MMPLRRARSESVELQRDETKRAIRTWQLLSRVGVCSVVAVVLSMQLWRLSWTPTYRFAGMAILVSAGLLFRHRQHFRRDASNKKTLASQLLWFPGYLASASLIAFATGAFSHSLAVMTLGCVFAIGRILASYVDPDRWRVIAPGWAVLFLLCIPSSHTWQVWETLQQVATEQLDVWGVLYLNQGNTIVWIESGTELSLSPNTWLSGYLFFLVTVCLFAWLRLPLAMTVPLLVVAFLLTQALTFSRILMEGWLIHIELANIWLTSEAVLCGGLWLLSGFLLATLAFVLRFFLAAVDDGSGSAAESLIRLWNRAVTSRLGDLMTNFTGVGRFRSTAGAPTPLKAYFRFLRKYIQTRPAWFLIASAPSVAIITFSVLGLMRSPKVSPEQIANHYSGHVEELLRQNRSESAVYVLTRLHQLQPHAIVPTLQVANHLLIDGKVDEARSLVQPLANQNAAHWKARLWMARSYLLSGDPSQSNVMLSQLSDQQVVEALRYLDINFDVTAGHEEPATHIETARLIAALYQSRHQSEQAARVLREVKAGDPESLIEVARLQKYFGFDDDASISSESILELVRSQPQWPDSVDQALVQAEAWELASQVDKASKTLHAAVIRWGERPELNQAWAELLLRIATAIDWMRSESDLENKEFAKLTATHEHHSEFEAPNHVENVWNEHRIENRLDLLQTIDQLAPTNTDYLRLLAKLLFHGEHLLASGIKEFAKIHVESAIRKKSFPADGHVILGTGFAQLKQWTRAQNHFRSAYTHGERSSSLFNNWAWVITQSSEVNWEHALNLANKAISIAPQSRDALLTRAEIFLELGRHIEAIGDYETVFQDEPHSMEIATKLAVCYEAIGETELAHAFRQTHRPRSN